MTAPRRSDETSGGHHRSARRRWTPAVVAVVLLLGAGCTDTSPEGAGGGATESAEPPGILRVLTSRDDLTSLDPQRVGGPVESALLGDFVHRTLVRYAQDPDPAGQFRLVPDLATDTGRPNEDLTEWTFSIRPDARWADGAPVTCADVAYGVSRQFAGEVLAGAVGVAVDLLDIPIGPDGTSVYEGPYSGEGQQFFDSAVTCDDGDLVFRLREPSADFAEATTLLSFAPVRQDMDTGDQYGLEPMSSGPYVVSEYTPGSTLLLRRSTTWDASSDPLRPAHPAEVLVELSVPPEQIARRIGADAGEDAYALAVEPLAPDQVGTPLADREWDEPGQTVTFLSVDTAQLPLTEQRHVVAAAVDRAAVVEAAGGAGAAEAADGVIAPGLVADYRPTGLWDEVLGASIPDGGDPEYAQELLARSGQEMPVLTLDYPDSAAAEAQVSAVVSALSLAGLTVEPNPVPLTSYYQQVLDPSRRGHLSWLLWRPDWANASRVLPPLFSAGSDVNLSGVNQSGGVVDQTLQDLLDEGRVTTDRATQAELFAQANERVVDLGLVVPLTFSRSQRAWGSGLDDVFYQAPLESYAFGQISLGPP